MTGSGPGRMHPLAPEVTHLAVETAQLCAELGQADAAQAIRAEAALAREGAAVAVVVGEKKRGKTSLINALLGRPDLLPVDADIATNVHLTVGYADPEWARAVNDQSPDGRDIALDEIAEYAALDPVTGKPQRPDVRQVEVGVAASLLADGLVLVDTPGVGGLVAGHRMITMATLGRADALVFVLSGASELTDSECVFLHEATERIATVLFVLTQVDKYPQWRDVLRKSQELVGVHASRFTGAQWFAVSSRFMDDATRAEQAGQSELAEQLRADSGFALLLDALRTQVAGRAQEIRLANLIQLTRPPLRRMIAAQEQRGRSLRRDPALVETITAKRAEVDQLIGSEASWRKTLPRGFAKLDADLRHDVTRMLSDLNVIGVNVISGGGRDVLDVVRHEVEGGLQGVWLEMGNHLRSGVIAILDDVAREFDVSGVDAVGELPYPDRLRNPSPLDPITPPGQGGIMGVVERSLPAYRTAAIVGTIVSYVATPLVGGPVGFLVGGLLELRRSSREKVQRARGDAQRYLQQILGEARTEIPAVLTAGLKEISVKLEDHLSGQLGARRKELTSALAEHERLLRESDAELARQTANLKAVLGRLRSADSAAESLLKRLGQGGDASAVR